MLKFVRNLLIGLLFCAAPASQLLAQVHPKPGSVSQAAVPCTGCPGVNTLGQANDGLPTYPYSHPIVNHTGRYVDSSNVPQYMHIGIRTIRAQTIRVAKNQRGSTPPRIYIQLGSALGAYTLDNFFNTKLPGGMVSIGTVFPQVALSPPGRNPPEKFLKWDQFVYPEANNTGWRCPFQDGQERLGDFDFDDRGYIYTAYTVFGWGIVKDDGKTDGSHMTKVVQMIAGGDAGNAGSYPKTKDDTSGVSPETIMVFKSGSKYYAVITDKVRSSAVWDVTDPASPRLVTTRATDQYSMRKWDRDDDSGRFAYLDYANRLHVYDYDTFIAGGAPILEQTGAGSKFIDVSFDDSSNLWVTEIKNNLWKFTKTSSSYSGQMYSPYGGTYDDIKNLHANGGFVLVAGTAKGSTVSFDLRLLKMESTGPRLVDVDNFFKKYYHESPSGYAEPAQYAGVQSDVQVIKWNGKTYIMYSVFGLGDVYEIEGSDAITIQRKNTPFGTANPHSAGTPGPYVGDIVTYSAPSSNPQVIYDVTWNFGNPEAGTSENQGINRSNQEISHQYTGLTTTGQITAAKTVQAVTIQDSAVASTYTLNLKVPTPRVGVQGTTTALSTNPTNFQVVAGQNFTDASDGSVEGHYATWTLDGGTPTKLAPNQTLPVGTVGPHTLQFQTAYGKYDGSFNGTSPYLPAALNFSYTVLPFKVALKAPTANATTVTFGATGTVTPDTSVITGNSWTITWTFTPGGGGTPTTNTQTVTLGQIPDFQIPKSNVTTGSTIKVEAVVADADLSTPAKPYGTSSDTMTLTTPDPKITISNCANATPVTPCRFTASSLGSASMSDWTFAWTLKQGSVPVKNGTGNPFETAITAAGTYTISLKATKSIFDTTVEQTFTVAAALCGPPPASHQVAINKSCSSCSVGQNVNFSASFNGYTKQNCDTLTWNFGDGSSATGDAVSHSYASATTYNVTLTISNTSGSAPLVETTTVTVGGGNQQTCTTPTSSIVFSGTSGCTVGVNCKTNEMITFTAKRAGGGNLQNCDTVSWSFSDGSTSTSRSVQKNWTTAGTYTATLSVDNTAGNASQAQMTVTVVNPPSGNCSVAPTVGNFSITYSANSGCSNLNGGACKAAEVVSFNADHFYYTPGSCDNYEWDFGDGTPKVNGRAATHTFAAPNPNGYPVKLRVYNNAGEWIYSKSVKIDGTIATQPVPILAATSFPSTGYKSRTITFTATSNIATTTGWTWNFGDGTASDTSQAGNTSTTSTITHTFANKGNFTVRVSARNSLDAISAPVGSVQGTINIADAPPIPEYRYLLPVTAHTSGIGGSAWRTDVQIYNPDPQVSETKPLIMEATFKGTTYPLQMIKATHIYEDFLGRLLDFQKDDAGPVIITTKSAMTPPQIWTRTYTQTPQGTFGQFIPAIRIDEAGGGAAFGTGKYYMAGLRHDNRYRTNVGFLNPNATQVVATVTVYDDRHVGIKQFTRTLQPFQLDQVTLKAIVDNLPEDRPFSLQIEVPDGQWLIAYASFIDGKSNDPVYIQAVRESEVAGADFKTLVIPGVGHTGAWRSDVTIFNPDTDGVVFDLQYFDNAGNKVAETPGIVLEPYKFYQYDDVLKEGVLGAAPDGLGTLKIVNSSMVPNNKYPIAFARTYNDDGANGTFGQGIGAFAAARPNVSPSKPALLAGVRNNSDYYTNIGLVNLTNAPVTATVTLLDPVTGAAAGSLPYSLKANETIVGQFAGFGSITSGTFKVEANGNIWAFVSIVDRRTKDPEYVPATPLQTQ